MCGFAAAINWPEAAATVGQLIEGLRHRGDVTDPLVQVAPYTVLCTRRLRIVDSERAIQPQVSCDGRLIVSFNGQIYNHAILRDEMIALGVRFQTESDTEVLVNALSVWGPQALERLSGMYAFVAVDIDSGGFLAARDPFGIKPLYVIQSGAGFLFCSEMKPLLDTVADGDVMMLPPGYALTATRCIPFQSAIHQPRDRRYPSDPATLDALLSEAVRTHLPPGLPVATLFSGGIDSTLIAHYARKFLPDSPGYFVGGETAPDYPFAAEYAAQTGYDLRFVEFEPESDAVFARIRDAVVTSESFEPNLIRGALCSLAAAERMRRDGFRIALCGEGADELFCGYPLLKLPFLDGNAQGEPIRDECLGLMHRVSLQRVDRCSMHYQIETRVPFLDPTVAEYALGLDAAALVRMQNGIPVGKVALRDLYDLYPESLPSAIRSRAKVLFDVGSGLKDTVWKARFNDEISDRAFCDGQKEFARFSIQSKEELYYLRQLSQVIDVDRVPHLQDRAWILSPIDRYAERLEAYAS